MQLRGEGLLRCYISSIFRSIGSPLTSVNTTFNIGPIPFSSGAGCRNPRVDEWFIRAWSPVGQSARAKLYFEAQEILANELPYCWLYEPRSSGAYNAALRGVFAWSAKSNVRFAGCVVG